MHPSRQMRGLFRALFSGLLITSLGQVPLYTYAESPKSSSDIYEELKAFTDVLAIVKRDYVREVSDKELVEGAIKGMLRVLDPHSGYLNPDFYKDLQVQTKGEFGGLGIEITVKEGLLTVVTPMEGSPADKAGVQAGDVIVKIDGTFTKDFSLLDAVQRLRGPKGSPVVISVSRKGAGALIDIRVVRDRIQVDSVKSRYLGDHVGYLRISQFMERTADDLLVALENIKKESGKNLRGVIVDVRNNPGGLLTQAVRVSDIFLNEGVVVYTQGRVESQKQKFFAHDRGTEPSYPIVVLVNGGSASASEILAGALKDHGRAIVLGTQTFGKGSVQTITPLENGGALTLTTALYYTKSGNSLQATGVEPDIVVKSQQELEDEEKKNVPLAITIREQDLPGAITNPDGARPIMQELNKTPTVDAGVTRIDPETVPLSEWKQKDRQFVRALEVLDSFDVFAERTAPERLAAVKEKFQSTK